jgi:hypothetical protein
MKWYHPIMWYFAWWEVLLLTPIAIWSVIYEAARVTEDDGQTTAFIHLPVEEIDRMIEGLQVAKQRILSRNK